jgi:thioredoxin reductase
MLDWLIIGGGIHGTYLAIYLMGRRGVKRDRIRILDPHEQPLALWQHFTANTGMAFLRSSHAHNLHYDPWSLVTFARTRQGEGLARFIEPYGRPALDLFQAHSQRLIERYRMNELRIVARAEGLRRMADSWCVRTTVGSIAAHNVIIAIGATERPFWPDWANNLRDAGAPIHHIFDADFYRASLPIGTQAAVVGGGITAAQTALTLAATMSVTLLMRHDVRVHDFDSDPRWIDPRQLAPFHREPDYAKRRAIISAARHRGSLPPDVAHDLQQAVLEGHLIRRMETVERGVFAGGKIQIDLQQTDSISADYIILATGFDRVRPGGAWIDHAINDYGLPTAPDGYPIVDSTLCWSPGLYVTGPLAELEVGPTARNIIGVRLAAERIGLSTAFR